MLGPQWVVRSAKDDEVRHSVIVNLSRLLNGSRPAPPTPATGPAEVVALPPGGLSSRSRDRGAL